MALSSRGRGPKKVEGKNRLNGDPDSLGEACRSDPRAHHYVMAHVALRQIGLSDPLRYLAILGSEEASGFLEHIFSMVSDDVTDQEADFCAEDIKVHCQRVGDYPCAVIEMPEPKSITETFFTGLVMLKQVGTDFSDGEKIPARYFTLEKGYDESGVSRTVFCEWSDEAHSNYGEGPEPTLVGFCEAIEAALQS
jgi:hypothetical protein